MALREGRVAEGIGALERLRCLLAHVRGERFEAPRMTEEGFEHFEALYAARERAAA